jgi:hypothetical protein
MQMIGQQSGLHEVLIRTTDTDVLVLVFLHFNELTATEIWIAFGCVKNFICIAAHDIANFLGPGKACALLAFYAFTGCDTMSFFARKERKIVWNTWNTFPKTRAFLAMVDRQVTEDFFATFQ